MESIPGAGFPSLNSLAVSRSRNAKRIISRLMYAAKTVNKETSKQHLSSYHSEIIQKVAGRIDKVTGFLLIYPTCLLHVLEADTATLMAILRSLQSDSSALESTCILSFTEDVTYRFFPSWMAGFINASNLGPYEHKKTKNLMSEISNLNINMLKWGKTLSEMDKTQQVQALDSVRSSAEEFLPDDPAAIFAFILAGETPKLQEFLEIYDLPPKDIIFENDILPLPLKLSCIYLCSSLSSLSPVGSAGVVAYATGSFKLREPGFKSHSPHFGAVTWIICGPLAWL